jgi:hypothetical protein
MAAKSIWVNSNKPSVTICIGLIKPDMNAAIIGTHAISETGNTLLNKRCIII